MRGNETCTNLVDPNGFPPQFDLIHNLAGIFCILLGQELTETITLVCH